MCCNDAGLLNFDTIPGRLTHFIYLGQKQLSKLGAAGVKLQKNGVTHRARCKVKSHPNAINSASSAPNQPPTPQPEYYQKENSPHPQQRMYRIGGDDRSKHKPKRVALSRAIVVTHIERTPSPSQPARSSSRCNNLVGRCDLSANEVFSHFARAVD